MAEMNQEAGLIEKYQSLAPDERVGYALVSMKIKRFRIISRLLGREAGNELLVKVYQAVSGWMGPGGYIAQIHLNYFNLLLPMPADYEGIFKRIIDLNRRVRDMPDDVFGGKVFCGFGVYPLTKEPVDFYIAQYNADISRSECPESQYRNSHLEVYGLSYTDSNLDFLDLQQMIKPAIDNGAIRLYLQPKVDVKTGAVTSAEALVRWVDPERGMIPVSQFLPGLEENGLIGDLDLFIFEEVCKRINQWRIAYGKNIHISVNLSRGSFNYLYFFEDYQRIYEQYLCPKECIEFELLESIVLNNVERVRQVVDQLREYGFTCSLDDFGSGYSSYSVLTNANLSMLKIDRSLFQNESDPREKIIIRSIIGTAHDLGMQTVAEGVETQGYVDYLKELGCDYIQGFVFYRPMPADEFEERFVRNSEFVRQLAPAQ